MKSKQNKLGRLLFKKIFLWYMIVATLLTMLQIYKEYVDNKNRLHLSFQNIESVFTGAVSSAVWNLDEEQIKYNAKAMSSMKNILGLIIIDPEGFVLAKMGTIDTQTKKYTKTIYPIEKTFYDSDMLQYSFELINTDLSTDSLGKVILYSSNDMIYAQLKENIFLIMINALLKSFVLMALFLFFTNRIISRSLHQLTHAINAVSIDSHKRIKPEDINVIGEHEISTLVKSYNDMQDRIHHEIERNRQLKDRMELALMGSNGGIWDWNIIENSVYFSPRWKEMLGYKDNELPNEISTWEDRVHPDDLEKTWKEVHENVAGKTKFYKNVHRLKHKDGHWVWILDLGKTLYDEYGKAIRMVGTHTDITEDKLMQLKLAKQAQIIEQIHDAVIATDLKGIITSWNKGAQLMLGYKPDDIIGKHISLIHLHKSHEQIQKSMDRLQKDNTYNDEIEFITKSNKRIIAEFSLSTLKDETQTLIGYIGYAHDISKRKEAENLLHYQAYHDSLTQLPNRALFHDRLKQSIEKAKRDKNIFALFFIDLDKFKDINDSLGHEIGDKVLQVTSERIKREMRTEDTLARLGGDEFTIIMQNISCEMDASILAQKIVDIIKMVIVIDEHHLYVTSSIGISLYPSDGTNAVDLLRHADIAMYMAKEKGRNNFQFYKEQSKREKLS